MSKRDSRSAQPVDVIHLFSSEVQSSSMTTYVVYLIPGNPGLIEFYRDFLTYLHALLSKDGNRRIIVYGKSLGGFEVGEPRTGPKSRIEKVPPYGLHQQIDFVEDGLLDFWAQLSAENGGNGSHQAPNVIIIGHSVGAYILLELVRRHRSRLASNGKELHQTANDRTTEPRIVAGICLFPTVTHIGKSRNGKVLTPLSKVPFFPVLIYGIVSVLTLLMPSSIIRGLVRMFTGFKETALETTMAFIKSSKGVYQALHMGRDEMAEITSDRWDAEIWGAAHPSPTGLPRSKLYFYFGQDDHWVADHTREDLMKIRGRSERDEKWKPEMEVDEKGVPHGFCIGSWIIFKIIAFQSHTRRRNI